MVGVSDADSEFRSLPVDEHIVFDSTLFIPPLGTQNRRAVGIAERNELARLRLLVHGPGTGAPI